MTNVFGISTRPDDPPFDDDQVRALLRQLPDAALVELAQEPEAVIERRIGELLKKRDIGAGRFD